jgi:type IV pilus assembly protein PilN
MRLNVNLATQPYEDVRKFLSRWGLLTALLAVTTALLVSVAVRNWRDSRAINTQIADLYQKMDALERVRLAAVDTLNRPENRAIADKSRFLNDAIERKSLSWTRIFMDLERMMPPGLHVVSVSPEFGKDRRIGVRLLVGGSSHQKAIELVRRMEESSTFKEATLHTETMASGSPDPVQFEITSTYIPPTLPGEAAPAASKTDQTMAKSGGTR